MDKKGCLRSLAVAYLVLGTTMLCGFSQYSTADFQSCYETCFVLCVIIPTNSVASCTFECLKDCIIPTSSHASPLDIDHSNNIRKENYNFCKLGCASSLCSNFSTKANPEVEKVGGCVDSCSETCTTKN